MTTDISFEPLDRSTLSAESQEIASPIVQWEFACGSTADSAAGKRIGTGSLTITIEIGQGVSSAVATQILDALLVQARNDLGALLIGEFAA